MMMVSVPYRGATFLNCGMNATIIYYNGFPSPIGELHFSIEFGIMDEWIRYVSVPYRGATFLNPFKNHFETLDNGFRPLSGSYISQCLLDSYSWIPGISFRPLSGSYISQSVKKWFDICKNCFRPLSGSYISQSCGAHIISKSIFKFPSPIGELHFSMIFNWTAQVFTVPFPSPIGELHFSISVLIAILRNTLKSFRPLSGSYISQWSKHSVRKRGGQVSVPYRGATFLNLWYIYKNPRRNKFPSPIGELHFSIPSPQPHVLSGTDRGIAGEK